MRRSPKITRDRFMAGRARLRTDELRPGNARWRENGAVRFEAAARKQDDGERSSTPDLPPESFALTVEPSSQPRMPHNGLLLQHYQPDYAFLRRNFGAHFMEFAFHC